MTREERELYNEMYRPDLIGRESLFPEYKPRSEMTAKELDMARRKDRAYYRRNRDRILQQDKRYRNAKKAQPTINAEYAWALDPDEA
jgi:hypothetical protein